MELTHLEERITPVSPTFDWLYNSSQFEEWEAFGAYIGGGPRVQVFHQGSLVFDQFVFEPDFRGGVDVSWSKDGDLMIGAGAGGGPRVRTFDVLGGEPLEDYFAFDPSGRDGLLILHGTPIDVPYAQKFEKIPIPPTPIPPINIFHATPHPVRPGNTTLVEKQIERIPKAQQQLLIDHDAIVYVFEAESVVELPEWAFLDGLNTSAGGDGNRQFNAVQALQSNFRVWITPFFHLFLLHEIGHTFQDIAGTPEWIEIWKRQPWEQPYESLNSNEAFAISYNYMIINGESRFPEVTEYLLRILPWE